MIYTLRYGIDSSLALDASGGDLTVCDAPRGAPLGGLPAALAAALAQPLDYPPLVRAVLPGDKVTLALGTDVPQVDLLVAGILAVLTAAGVKPGDVTVLRTEVCDRSGIEGAASASAVPEAAAVSHGSQRRGARGSPTVLTHDPAHRGQLAFLGSTGGGGEIYLHRALSDADVVITLGCLRIAPSAGYYGVSGGIFPAFSDARTQARFRGLDQLDASADLLRKGAADVAEAARLLGSQFTVQVVPGRGDEVLHVLAGLNESVERRGNERMQAAWRCTAPRRAELVIAAIEGPAERQSWTAVGRALAAACPVVADDGAIAVCSDLAASPGAAVESLARGDDRHRALRHWRKHPPADLLPAVQLTEALSRGRVYLLSRLEETQVEELGMAAVANAGELARLVSRYGSCLAIANAQHARVAVAGEED